MNDMTNLLEFPSRSIDRARPLSRAESPLLTLAARASLAVLASGFSLLGLITVVWHSTGLENQSCYLGGAASVFVGAIFFAAACAYWRR
jgi:hypothetical protein